jgi:hypothetical protein
VLTVDELIRRVAELAAELAAEGLYEPGKYTKSARLSAGPLHEDENGGAWFTAETTENNTDRKRVKVTFTRE